MRKYFIRPGFDFIQLFAEGGGGEGGTGAGAAAATAAEGQNAAAPAQPQTKGAKNPLADVQYGNEADPADAGQGEDRAARFEELISGEYKDLYEGRIKDTISRRLKGTEETVNRYNALTPVLELLADKYGVDKNDVEALSKAVEDDDTYFEEEALEKGMTVQQVKEIRKMRRENETLKAQMEQRRSEEQANQTYAAWLAEAEQIKQIYPSFDLKTELQNPRIQKLIVANIPLKDAYEAVHLQDILGGAMQFTAGRVAQKVANNVAAGRSRPTEGAMAGKSSVRTTKRDVSQLTKAERLEIAKQAKRGAIIGFD